MNFKHVVAISAIFFTINNTFAACSDPLGREVDWNNCDKSQQRPFIYSNANISDGKFNGANLQQATLYGWAFDTQFKGAMLRGVRFVSYPYGSDRSTWDKADFTGANFTGYTNEDTVLEGPFTNAKFNNATIKWANLNAARFPGADFTGAKIDLSTTKISSANFNGATWVDGKKKCGYGSIGKCTSYNKPLNITIYRKTLDFRGSEIVLSTNNAVFKNDATRDWLVDAHSTNRYIAYVDENTTKLTIGVTKRGEEELIQECQFDFDPSKYSEFSMGFDVSHRSGDCKDGPYGVKQYERLSKVYCDAKAKKIGTNEWDDLGKKSGTNEYHGGWGTVCI